MTHENVKSFEQEAFKLKLGKLSKLEAVSDADFADAVYKAMSSFGIDESQFRDTFSLSKGAVDRWTMQKNLPQPNIRPKILGWILAKI